MSFKLEFGLIIQLNPLFLVLSFLLPSEESSIDIHTNALIRIF